MVSQRVQGTFQRTHSTWRVGGMGCLIRQYIERWRDIVLEDQQLSEIESTESVLKYFALADPTAILSYYDP